MRELEILYSADGFDDVKGDRTVGRKKSRTTQRASRSLVVESQSRGGGGVGASGGASQHPVRLCLFGLFFFMFVQTIKKGG